MFSRARGRIPNRAEGVHARKMGGGCTMVFQARSPPPCAEISAKKGEVDLARFQPHDQNAFGRISAHSGDGRKKGGWSCKGGILLEIPLYTLW